MLLTWHNLQFYQDVMRGLRGAIETRTLADWSAWFGDQQEEGDIDAL